jgi:hypothetical protein
MDDMSGHRLICQNPGTAAQVSAGAMLVQNLLAREMRSTLTVNNYFGVLQAVLSASRHRGAARLPDRGFSRPGARAARCGKRRGAGVPGLSRGIAAFARIAAFRDFVLEEIMAYRRSREAHRTPGQRLERHNFATT